MRKDLRAFELKVELFLGRALSFVMVRKVEEGIDFGKSQRSLVSMS